LIDKETIRSVSLGFDYPKNWSTYKEPKWYENIPDDGVLCWFGEAKAVCIVFPVIPNTDFNASNYTPLTKQEIQVFMDNAPEEV
jgi:hypothetical protein